MTIQPPSSPNFDLMQQLETAWRERDQAQTSAKRWRRLYEVEAQQRQKDTEIADQTIQSLRAEIQHLCQFPTNGGSPLSSSTGHSAGSSTSVHHLRHQIADLITERDQLLQALTQEQNNHAHTRENLISALSDALGSQRQKHSLALPSSRAGARTGAIILKDRDARNSKSD